MCVQSNTALTILHTDVRHANITSQELNMSRINHYIS